MSPPNRNFGDAPENIYNLVDVIVSHVSKLNTEFTIEFDRKVNYTKDKAS